MITSEIFQPINRHRYQFVGEVMMVISSTKEIIKMATFEILKGTKKMQFLSLLFLELTY